MSIKSELHLTTIHLCYEIKCQQKAGMFMVIQPFNLSPMCAEEQVRALNTAVQSILYCIHLSIGLFFGLASFFLLHRTRVAKYFFINYFVCDFYICGIYT